MESVTVQLKKATGSRERKNIVKMAATRWMCVLCMGIMAAMVNVGCGGGDDDDSGSARITLAEFNEIQIGMSYDQVAAIVAPASKDTDMNSGSIRIVQWGDKKSETILTVTFINGKVWDKLKSDNIV